MAIQMTKAYIAEPCSYSIGIGWLGNSLGAFYFLLLLYHWLKFSEFLTTRVTRVILPFEQDLFGEVHTSADNHDNLPAIKRS
jgi:hypothetical protein